MTFPHYSDSVRVTWLLETYNQFPNILQFTIRFTYLVYSSSSSSFKFYSTFVTIILKFLLINKYVKKVKRIALFMSRYEIWAIINYGPQMAQDMIGQWLGYTGLTLGLHQKGTSKETAAVEHTRKLPYMLSKPSKILRIWIVPNKQINGTNSGDAINMAVIFRYNYIHIHSV